MTPTPASVVERELFNDRAAAAFIGCSVGKVRAMRGDDRARIAQGEPPLGPRWIVLQARHIRYRRAALLEWIEANSQECGTVPFSNRGRDHTTDQGART